VGYGQQVVAKTLVCRKKSGKANYSSEAIGYFMQFLVLTRRKTSHFAAEDFAGKYDAEVARAKALFKEGFSRQVWHRADGTGACQIVEATDYEEVERAISSLPFAASGMLEIEIIALKPYAGFHD
jgi:muconolactone delta-isomerase